jgi:hypothetical protein
VLNSRNDISLDKAIFRTLMYFDIFNYPLKINEIHKFLPVRSSENHVADALHELVGLNQVCQNGEMYSIRFDQGLFERRVRGNTMAKALTPMVGRQARLIHRFPFVRSVMASGSFSKNYMDEKSDFDFFIICAPNRIWISRMLLVFYKRVFLKNSHKHFCVNYFVDERNLAIPERNIFTATELATVLPLTGAYCFSRLIEGNQSWLSTFFPNMELLGSCATDCDKISLKKIMLEAILNICCAPLLNKLFKRMTLARWRKGYAHEYSEEDFKLAFKSTDGVSKNHPRNFQKKIILEFEHRIQAINSKVAAA